MRFVFNIFKYFAFLLNFNFITNNICKFKLSILIINSRKYKVLLIEAGGNDSYPWIHIPVGYYKTMHNPKTDWCYNTEPDASMENRSIPYPRGKTLGGSSSINGLLYIRGQEDDYNLSLIHI